MATFIVLANFTDQGIRNVKESPDRFEAYRAMAEKHGVVVKSVHYTVGRYDMVVVLEGSEEAVMATGLKSATLGNVRSETLCGFSLDEMRKLVGLMP